MIFFFFKQEKNQSFNTRAWGGPMSMKIPKTLRKHWVYRTFLDKGERVEEEYSISDMRMGGLQAVTGS